MKNLENNKLIAEFEGHTINYGFKKEGVLFLGHHISANDLIYDTSWNWLMPVVEKISKLDTLDKERDFNRALDRVLCLPIDAKIDVVYFSVVEFIKWYNKNK